MRLLICALSLGLGCGSSERLSFPLADLPGVHSAPDVITRQAAVLFWLETADTLRPDSTSDAIQHLQLLADGLGRLLEEAGIPLLATNSARIYIGGDGRPRRSVTLVGLDYPWGVILVDPGYPEQIITGPVDSEDVEDLAWSYFELDDAPRHDRPRRIALEPSRSKAARIIQDRSRAADFQRKYAGIPDATTPTPRMVCIGGCVNKALSTMAAALNTNSSGVSGYPGTRKGRGQSARVFRNTKTLAPASP
jgi:hypothetical protein